jgi:bacillithiol biosynthesis deacetylase BshB1
MEWVFRAEGFAQGGTVEVLAIGAHPDDVEIGTAGFLALQAELGRSVGIADLTAGELGTRGDRKQRAGEAAAAARLLGAAFRLCLGWPDGGVVDDPDGGRRVATLIRRFRPVILLAPAVDDVHPDHCAAGRVARRAAFLARLRRLDLGHPPHSPALVLHYSIHTSFTPHLVVDIGSVFERRMAAAGAFGSQFGWSLREIEDYRPVGTPDYLPFIAARCRHYGALIGVEYGEGFRSAAPLPVPDPMRLLEPVHSGAAGDSEDGERELGAAGDAGPEAGEGASG